MSIQEEIHAEIVELESTVELLKDEIKVYRENNKDGVERWRILSKMQMELGKHTRRLRDLKALI